MLRPKLSFQIINEWVQNKYEMDADYNKSNVFKKLTELGLNIIYFNIIFTLIYICFWNKDIL